MAPGNKMATSSYIGTYSLVILNRSIVINIIYKAWLCVGYNANGLHKKVQVASSWSSTSSIHHLSFWGISYINIGLDSRYPIHNMKYPIASWLFNLLGMDIVKKASEHATTSSSAPN